MSTITDISYGVVPLRRHAGEWLVLVIHQKSWTGERFWIFPKGHAEESETPIAAAARELQEETGVRGYVIQPTPTFVMRYTFTHAGNTIKKTVTYFLGIVKDVHTEITQPEEVVALRWCSLEEAKQLLTHQNSLRILEQVQAYLTTSDTKLA